ncbi:hypothetical protein [Rubripirellula lacrimiformis]|uniref:hypothetical protein n=1 Tax=Rubripirellula lacrimiformis TaxID=1930273 RepID=UPI001C54E9D5|nr:hypothetical protein [Rubripirellula lacrimiformis]
MISLAMLGGGRAYADIEGSDPHNQQQGSCLDELEIEANWSGHELSPKVLDERERLMAVQRLNASPMRSTKSSLAAKCLNWLAPTSTERHFG